MNRLKQWLAIIILPGIVPTAAFLIFAQYMQQREVVYYAVGVPLLYLYFYILGRLGVSIPGNSDGGSMEPTSKGLATAERIIFILVFPTLGTAFIFQGVRDGDIMLNLFPATGFFWGSGVWWVSKVPLFSKRH